jgi:tetratricopeptide (TPR) repeat protein
MPSLHAGPATGHAARRLHALQRPSRTLLALAAAWFAGTALAAAPAPPELAASAAAPNSSMDGNTFLHLIIGELEAQGGQSSGAYERMLAVARQTRDEGLFQRAIELAVQARSPDKAITAAKAWRSSMPESSSALRLQLQLLVALERPNDLVEPIRTLVEREPVAERSATIAALPRFLGSLSDKPRALAVAEQALSPFAGNKATRTAVRTALGRLSLAASQPEAALAHARRALLEEPDAPGPVLLALELMPQEKAAEPLVQGYLARADALPPIRLAYARTLDQQQRIGEAAVQLRQVLAKQPDQAAAWLSLGAYLVDLREPDEAIRALEQFLRLAPAAGEHQAPDDDKDDTDGDKQDPRSMTELAWLLIAQAHEQRGDDRSAGQWLDKIEPARVDMTTLVRRASLMARAGQVTQARALVREAPARDQPDARTRLLAEAQVLRDQRQWAEAYEVLLSGVRQDPDDTTLMYELAMVAERLQRFDDMEALLKRVMTLKPEDHHAHNALGYSLADRNIRLDEAQGLLQKAARLAPHDPFILDSLGWVEYRLGRREAALKLLRQSHLARPHVEVAAHLGELLWVMGEQEEARRVWREGRQREADNEVLHETLARLKVQL